MFKNYNLLLALLCLCTILQAQGDSDCPPRTGIVLLPSNVNKNTDSYAPFRYGDKIFFTATNRGGNGMPVSRMFSADENEGGPTLLDINPQNDALHAANMTMTPDGKTMYYTLCKDGAQNECTIWSREKLYDGGWEAAAKLPAHINQRKSTATQPAIGYDWGLKKYVLYFVSDRPGGAGGKDIWYSVIGQDRSYGEPAPMPFNTTNDEVTPYFHLPEQTLFFSSNGLLGHGGFDVFSTKRTSKAVWEEPANQGSVLNSQYDETYFTYHTNVKKGYFASDRPTLIYGKDNTRESHINIYEINQVVELTLPVYNAHNMAMLNSTSAHVYDETTGQKMVFHEQPFDTNLKVALLPERVYKVAILKDGFLPSVIEVSTEGVVFPVALKQEVHLFIDEALMYSNREAFGQEDGPSQTSEKEDGKKTETGIEKTADQAKTDTFNR